MTSLDAPTIISPSDVLTLNAAREILRGIRDLTLHHADKFSAGYVAGVAEVAKDAIFDVLNSANAYGLASLTDEQLHDRR